MNSATQMQKDKPRWDIFRTKLDAENAAALPLNSLPVHRNGNNKFGYVVKLTFGEPVKGPISLGASSHFGLGLFVPANPVESSL